LADETDVKKKIEMVVVPFYAEKLADPSIIMVVRDYTLLSENEHIKIENKYKNLLIGSASHELKTPVNGILRFKYSAILGMLQLLDEINQSAESREYLKIAQQSTIMLNNYIDGMIVRILLLLFRISQKSKGKGSN
jgi:signal transduction histidine kinase